MSENPPENPPVEEPVKALPASEATRFALYDTAELRYLPGVFESAKAARDAHKGSLVEGRKYDARKV